MTEILKVIQTVFPGASLQKDYRGYYTHKFSHNYVDFCLWKHSGPGFTISLKFCNKLIGEWTRHKIESLPDAMELVRLELAVLRDYLVEVTTKE
jgi:hypothetical protein